MFRPFYDWTLRQAAKPHADYVLGSISFAESSFSPVPPDVMMVPMALARPDRVYTLAFICTLGSVLGGLFGYALGYFLAPFALDMLKWMGQPDALNNFQHLFNQWGTWVILLKGATPIPYKLVTIPAGLAQFSLGAFIATSVITRGVRFYLTAYLLKRFGPQARDLMDKRLNSVMIGVALLIVFGIVIMKFI